MKRWVKKVSVKASKLVSAKKRFPKVITVTGAVGRVRHSKIVEGSSKRVSVGKSSGAIMVKKGTMAGLYRIRAAVQA